MPDLGQTVFKNNCFHFRLLGVPGLPHHDSSNSVRYVVNHGKVHKLDAPIFISSRLKQILGISTLYTDLCITTASQFFCQLF